ncbi:hypothetical protein MTHERMOG20_23580 [Moorella thermoacetica]|nr:hypothetical protein MTHERMOG20_23580 [Moorella thermoacetica]
MGEKLEPEISSKPWLNKSGSTNFIMVEITSSKNILSGRFDNEIILLTIDES